MITRQEKVILVDFMKTKLWAIQNSILLGQKKLFSKPYEASFLACKFLSTCFLHLLCIQKMFVRVSGIFWYKLEHHTTRRNEYATGESDFGRFYENDTRLTWEHLTSEKDI